MNNKIKLDAEKHPRDGIDEHYKEMEQISDPFERINKQIEYLKTQPLLNVKDMVYPLEEIRKLWELHKKLL